MALLQLLTGVFTHLSLRPQEVIIGAHRRGSGLGTGNGIPGTWARYQAHWESMEAAFPFRCLERRFGSEIPVTARRVGIGLHQFGIRMVPVRALLRSLRNSRRFCRYRMWRLSLLQQPYRDYQ